MSHRLMVVTCFNDRIFKIMAKTNLELVGVDTSVIFYSLK